MKILPSAIVIAITKELNIIPITGSLVNRFSGAWGSVTGYDYIRMAFDAANIDPSISSIAFDVNSPGGQVHGCFELAERAFVAGAHFTVADITAIVTIDFMRAIRAEVPEHLTHILRWRNVVSQRPSMKA